MRQSKKKLLRVEIVPGEYSYEDDGYRYVYYRPLPSGLPLFQRWFMTNGWHSMYYQSKRFPSKRCYLFNKHEFYSIKKQLKTVGDVEKYLADEDAKMREYKNEKIANEEFWPDC